jgi:hypothetical protein
MQWIRAIGAVLVVTFFTVGFLARPPASAAATPEQQLAERYSPILMLKVNDDPPCGRRGEQYAPTSVAAVLGNPDVQLVQAPEGRRSKVVKNGATIRDIAGLGEDYYLNQPGNPYRPGCTYARDSQRLTRTRPPVAYAHVAREPGTRGVALQYWFYYWYNHFNDLHESDWEMIQLAFDDAASVEEALAGTPSHIAYAQHGGGERADWDDEKVEKEGSRPVVYVASGSHASQYESALYLGRGRQGAGLGCDDTRGPSRLVRPRPVVVSTSPATTSEDAWLTYRGHWGQKARGFSNGVGGPNLKTQWREPFGWMDGLRTSTPKMPISQTAGVTVTDFFCEAIIFVASAGNYVGNRIWLLLVLVLGLAVATVVPVRRTSWSPAGIEPLRQRRATGQLLRAAARVYRDHARTMLALALIVVLLASILAFLLRLLDDHTGVTIVISFGDPGLEDLAAVVVGAPAYPLVLVLVGAPFVAVLRRLDAGEPAGAWPALREVLPLLPRLLLVEILAFAALLLLVATVIGIPLAIKKAVDWAFAGHEVVFNRRTARAALGASTRRVRGRWWSIAVVILALFIVGALVGPLVGAALIMLTDASLWTINVVGLVVFGLTLPYMLTTLTLVYLDPRTQTEPSPRAWGRRLVGLGRRHDAAARADA